MFVSKNPGNHFLQGLSVFNFLTASLVCVNNSYGTISYLENDINMVTFLTEVIEFRVSYQQSFSFITIYGLRH